MRLNSTLGLVGAASMAALTSAVAQLQFSLGPVPYTVQNFAYILAGLVLGPWYGGLSQLIYLALIAIGLPVAAGFSGGLPVLFGFTAGYLWMFPVSAFLMGSLARAARRRVPELLHRHKVSYIWSLVGLSGIAVLPVYLVGFAVFYSFATLPTALGEALSGYSNTAVNFFGITGLDPFTTIFAASVLIFIPQDLFVDHLLAAIVAIYVNRLIRVRGIRAL